MNPPFERIDLTDVTLPPTGDRHRRLVIVVRADPVVCGHSGEARNLAEAAMARGFEEVRIITWPIDRLRETGLPLKPLDRIAPYGPGITVERPEPVGDYKVPDGRYGAGIVGRLVELFSDGVPTLCLSLYLVPHTTLVTEAIEATRRAGIEPNVTTVAEAVGSDITNVVRGCVSEGRIGAAVALLGSYLASDHVVAVSAYTKELIVAAASEVDAIAGTRFREQCERRIDISYPAIATEEIERRADALRPTTLAARDLPDRGYLLSLCRLSPAKGIDDLIAAHEMSAASHLDLVIAGRGPDADRLAGLAARSTASGRIVFLDDVDDDEKLGLMAGCAAYVLPSKPRTEFVETFGISLVEAMLSGAPTVITTPTGGIPEAVGDAAVSVEPGDVGALADALDDAVVALMGEGTAARIEAARCQGRTFDRTVVLSRLLDGLPLAGQPIAA